MNISIQMILDKLSDYNFVIKKLNNTSIKFAKLIEKKQSVFESDCLYIGNFSDFKDIILLKPQGNFIIVLPECQDELPDFDICGTIIFLISNDDIFKIYNTINNIINIYIEWSVQLLQALFDNKGILEILNIGQKLLTNPIHVIDTIFTLIAYTNGPEVDDPEWTDHIKQGFNTYKNIAQLKVGKYIEKVFKSSSPIIIHPSFYKNRILMTNIYIDGKIVGHVALNEGVRPFLDSDLELTEYLGKIISYELNKNNFFHNTKGELHEHFIIRLLNNELNDPLTIEEKLKTLGWLPKKNLRLLYFVYNQKDNFNIPLVYIKNVLDAEICNSKSVIFNDGIALIIESNNEEVINKKFIESLEAIASKYMLKCGISINFNKIDNLKKYLRQCLAAIDSAEHLKRKNSVYLYEEYAIYHALSLCINEIDIKELCYPPLLNLIEFDNKNHTKYTLTLFTYLESGLNMCLSAKKLFIHHNTMRFRIEKIQNMLNINLDDGKTISLLYNSFKVLEYLGEFQSID
ncbi:hypothetical protein FDN13_12295 [Caloramator sp. E03]|uniref:PucR family transcriptional regulator n=1 Tax=Caloramator sp. E03 TaxID=2576307 RepID=UPI0011109F72|nr:helix-turn-helix domain-containing protein [Caloramator sp. E03]QCX34414.1 hypothetical protein FDN13_12295 [Caloramator sp. E03]